MRSLFPKMPRTSMTNTFFPLTGKNYKRVLLIYSLEMSAKRMLRTKTNNNKNTQNQRFLYQQRCRDEIKYGNRHLFIESNIQMNSYSDRHENRINHSSKITRTAITEKQR